MNCRFIQPTPQPAHIGGGREIWELVGQGPASYNQTTGDLISGPGPGEHFGVPIGGFITPDGIYALSPFSTSPGTTGSLRLTWGFRWTYAGSGGLVGLGKIAFTAGSGQTNGTFNITASSGGAVVQIVIAGGAITSAIITNPGSYAVGASAPTFTVSEGGTPGTLTATMGVPGQEIPTGVNLSAEYVQFGAIGGQM